MLPYIPIINVQRISLEPCSERYTQIGDAAMFMDPFFCPGIDFAFASAEKAVEAFEHRDFTGYREFIEKWAENSGKSVYKKIGQSSWKQIIRLFSDPHLPFMVPLFLTQAFGQAAGKPLDLKEGIDLAREAYEPVIH